MRSGSVATRVPDRMGELWRVKVGSKVSPPVAAGARLYVAVVDETKAPPRKIKSIQEFSEDLLGGEYGMVIESISGKRWADQAAAVDWNLSKFAGEDLRLYLVDAVTNHYGQLAVSEIRITESVE